ncbi:MAG: sulfatase [Bryobacterales bacterium]|nr:sulfatase [Bryobacterales bacterium]
MIGKAFLAILALGAASLSPGQASRADRPNFVLILADDLGYGDLASYGHPSFQTPHLDQMAAQGVRFTDFYVPMPYCAPSRASILTGRYPFRHGIVGNPTPDNGVNDYGLPASEVTIAQALKHQGYAATCIGKWHLGHIPEYLPTKRGFDSYFGILYSNDMRPVQLVEDDRVVEYPVVQGELTKRYTQRALGFIESHSNRPFFLYLPHAMPHKPLAASEDFYTPHTPHDLYADVIRELDWSVGQILTKLQELDLDRNTLVVFTSDNGPSWGGSTGGLRGMKGRTWEGGIRVPLIAWWPGRITPGLVTNEVAASVDIFPTFLSLAGVPLPGGSTVDGRDMFPLMTAVDARSPHEAIFAMAGGRLHIVRSGRWKLHVRPPGPPRGPANIHGYIESSFNFRRPDGTTIIAPFEQPHPTRHPGVLTGDRRSEMMLFDLEADPSEQRDIADAHPEVVERLKALFDEHDGQETPRPEAGFSGLRRVKGGALEYDSFVR